MAARRTDMHRLQELVRLHRMGARIREVTRLLKMSPKTELGYRKALKKAGLLEGPPEEIPELATRKAAVAEHLPPKTPPQQTSSIAAWEPQIRAMVERQAGPQAIYDRLRLEGTDFGCSLSAVKRMVVRIQREAGVDPRTVAIPVTSDPGHIAQVDFGYVGKLFDPETGRLRKTWLFFMVLAYSRLMVGFLVFDQKIQTWLDCHIRAFQVLGGAPQVVVPDNLKVVQISSTRRMH